MRNQFAAGKDRQKDKYYKLMNSLTEKERHVIDYLPMDVPKDAAETFSDVEYYLLNSEKKMALKDRFEAVIYKLMCFYKLCILWGEWEECPKPERIDEILYEIMGNYSGTLNFLFPDINMLIVCSWDALNMEVYNPSKSLQIILKKVAASEGLFFR